MVFGFGEVIWVASQFVAKPINSPKILAPRALACSYSSNTTVPAPSPMTKPSLSLSKGAGVSFGVSF